MDRHCACANTRADHADVYCLAFPNAHHANAHFYSADPHQYSHRYADPYTDTDHNSDQHGHTDPLYPAHLHADRDVDTLAVSNLHAHLDAEPYEHTFCYPHANRDAGTLAYCIPDTSSIDDGYSSFPEVADLRFRSLRL